MDAKEAVDELTAKVCQGLAQDLRDLKESVRKYATVFFNVQERDLVPTDEAEFFGSKSSSKFPQVRCKHSGVWREMLDHRLPDPGCADDGFELTSEQDTKLHKMMREYVAVSRRTVGD